ncbi:hypothetical protein ACLOJK_041734 [Asimina triloba]
MEGEPTTTLASTTEMNEGKGRWSKRMRGLRFKGEGFREEAIEGGKALLRKYDSNWEMRTEGGMGEMTAEVWPGEAKNAAIQIEHRLLLGSKLSDVINSKEDASALFDLFRDEGYILTEHNGRFCVILKEGCAPHDMLRSLFHVNYLYWLERNVGIESRGVAGDCSPGGRLDISLDYVKREFDHVKHDGLLVGWVTDGLIARPLPNRIRLGYTVEQCSVLPPVSKAALTITAAATNGNRDCRFCLPPPVTGRVVLMIAFFISTADVNAAV